MPRSEIRTARFDLTRGMSIMPLKSEEGDPPLRFARNVTYGDGIVRKRKGRRSLIVMGTADPVVGAFNFHEPGQPSYLVTVQRISSGHATVRWFSGRAAVDLGTTSGAGSVPAGIRVEAARLGCNMLFSGHSGGPWRFHANGTRLTLNAPSATDRDAEGFQVAGSDPGPYRTAPPILDHIISHQFRIFGSRGNTIYWTSPDDVFGWPINNYTDIPEGGPITALASFGRSVIVFTRDAMWDLRGLYVTVENTDMRLISPKVGCVSAGSIQNVGGALIFRGENTIWKYDGSRLERISTAIEPIFNEKARVPDLAVDLETYKALPSSAQEDASVFRSDLGLYVLSYIRTGTRRQDGHAAYDVSRGAWSIWDGFAATAHVNVETTSGTEALWYTGDSEGVVFAMWNGHRDDDRMRSTTGNTRIPVTLVTDAWRAKDGVDHTFREVLVTRDDEGYLGSTCDVTAHLNGGAETSGMTVWDAPTTSAQYLEPAGSTPPGFALGAAAISSHLPTSRVGVGPSRTGQSIAVQLDDTSESSFAVAGIAVNHWVRRARHGMTP